MGASKWKLITANGGWNERPGIYAALIDFDKKCAVLVYNSGQHRSGRDYGKSIFIEQFGADKSRVEKNYGRGGMINIEGFIRGASISADIFEFEDSVEEYGKSQTQRKITSMIIEESLAVLAGLAQKLVPQHAKILFGPRQGNKIQLSFDEFLKKFRELQGIRQQFAGVHKKRPVRKKLRPKYISRKFR